MELNYSTYLKLDQLLSLQEPQAPEEHDELLFITVHQVYELWFQQLLHELAKVAADFSDDRVADALHTVKRCVRILTTLVAQLDVLETMKPTSFAAFRERLDSASGFQSMQFRQIEFLLGLKRESVLAALPDDDIGVTEARKALVEPCLMDHLHELLAHRGVLLPPDLAERDPTAAYKPHPIIEDAVLWLYTTSSDIAVLFDLLMDFDQALQDWRYRHLQLTRRVIGSKPGTHGSDGAGYLESTLFHPVFPELWAIAHRM